MMAILRVLFSMIHDANANGDCCCDDDDDDDRNPLNLLVMMTGLWKPKRRRSTIE